ncbi:MAG TPA: GNAT family N-acetyltransferase [Pirellulales bacterium]|nr:GNAT family N-acetyltransferase [Pirellulales bacterium]
MDLLDRLLGHDAWTTQQLLQRCRDLSDEQLDREFDIAHRSVRATLTHVIRNVEVWSQLMAGRQVVEGSGTSVGELIARLNRVAAELAQLARGVAERRAWDARFLDTLDSPPVEKTFGGGIAHIVTHSMHHRAQLLYMLRRLGVKDLPEGDVLSWEQQTGGVSLRDVVETDLAEFFEHQRDPVANAMAAFPPRDCDAFMTHWQRILADDNVVKRTIVFGAEVAGNVLCWEESGERLVGYWLGRRFWRQGIATRALSTFTALIPHRPLHAHVARQNVASLRVLEKCGFEALDKCRAAAPTGGEVVEEIVYSLSKRWNAITR